VELEQLRQFLIVARTGNITRASHELGLSQSALSRSIQRLENEFGQPLFERQTRAVTLTDAGLLLETRAEQVLGIIADTKSEIADDGQSGRLRLAAIPTIAPFFLPEFLRQFSADYPKAMLVVQEDTTDNLVRRIKQGEIDLAVLALPIPAKYLEVEELFREELLVVLDPQHPLATKKKIVLADVESQPFVLLDEAHCLSENVISFCRQRQFHPLVMERASQLAMVQELVSLGHGVSMVPEMARRIDESSRRVYRSFSGEKPTRTIALASNPYRFQSKLLGALRERLKTYCREFCAHVSHVP
jgi:LysR family hydrogen peroxide-inducible transcriptional activator